MAFSACPQNMQIPLIGMAKSHQDDDDDDDDDDGGGGGGDYGESDDTNGLVPSTHKTVSYFLHKGP